MIGTTIAPVADLARALVTAKSFARYNPAARFVILVPDAFVLSLPAFEGVDLLGLEDIALSSANVHRLPKIYRSAELGSAVKPWLLRKLHSAAAGGVVYLDPDIEVFSALDDIADQANGTSPLFASRNDPAGVPKFDEGFVALQRSAEGFLTWWCGTLEDQFDCGSTLRPLSSHEIPTVYDVQLVADLGCNVGYWNLPEHRLSPTGDSYAVDGQPLRFFHFDGYDPKRPYLLSTDQPYPPRGLLSQSAALRQLCENYRAQLSAAAEEEHARYPFGYGLLPSGTRIDRYMHRAYARALRRSDTREGPKPPDPLGVEGETAFLKWLNQRTFDGQPVVTRYMLEMHASRTDLQAAFPEPLGCDATSFHTWFVTSGAREEDVPLALLPPRAQNEMNAAEAAAPPREAQSVLNVEVVGYFRAELGVGEAARLLVTALHAAEVGCITKSYGATASRQEHAFAEQRTTDNDAPIEIICLNADQLPTYAQNAGVRRDARRYTIGFWFWEADEFPESLHPAFDLVDEVWAASDFVRDTLLKVSTVPVLRVNLPLVAPEVDSSLSRSSLGLPSGFVFLFSFDYFSLLERKNPVGLVNAFKQAFSPGEGPMLVIKSINGDQRIIEMEKLKFAVGDRPDILLLDGYLSSVEKNTMTALCDCYVSLHRAEGFGLTMAEAMALAKPVIATGYSGNLAFMTADNSYLCQSTPQRVGKNREPYPPHASWAEPDIDDASRLLRHVYEHQSEARERGARAAEDLQRLHSPALAGGSMRARLEIIQSRLNASEAERSASVLHERLQFFRDAERAIRSSLDARARAE